MSDAVARQLERIADGIERLILTIEGARAAAPASAVAGPGGHPTFCGLACAWTVDAAGFPGYVVTADGEIADKHERQGDVWYSVKDEQAAGGYRRVLTIKAGETLPDAARFRLPDATRPDPAALQTYQNGAQTAPDEPPPTEQAPEPPDPANPFEMIDAVQLRRLHELGRAVYGDAWVATGPQLVLAASDGRTDRSADLSDAEGRRMIADLTAQQPQRARKGAAYAG